MVIVDAQIRRFVWLISGAAFIGFGAAAGWSFYKEGLAQREVVAWSDLIIKAIAECDRNSRSAYCTNTENWQAELENAVREREENSAASISFLFFAIAVPLFSTFLYSSLRWVVTGERPRPSWLGRPSIKAGPSIPKVPVTKSSIAGLKRFGYVVLAAIAVCFPAIVYVQRQFNSPSWYQFLAGVMGAIGLGLVPMMIGVIILVSRRNRVGGGLKIALIVTVVASLLSSYFLLYPTLRSL